MDRTVTIDGKTVTLRSSALVPRLYRHHMGRDIIRDMATLRTAYRAAEQARKDGADEDEQDVAALSYTDLEIFENVAWIMLKHAAQIVRTEDGVVVKNGDMVVGNSPDEWLEQMDGVFSVYDVMPVILELWEAGQKTTSVPAKK